ncbi:MAG: hypothetical protein ACLQOO_34680 [Terriglobia bacterium]
MGLVACSVNALLLCGYVSYCFRADLDDRSSAYAVCAEIGYGLCVLALLTAVVGKGRSRPALAAAAAVLGFFGWTLGLLAMLD